MNAIWAARQEGVERVARLSAVGASHDAPTRSGRLHALSDHERSGMYWTILRPLWFMQNLLNEAAEIGETGSFSLNMGEGRLGMIDVRDIVAFAAQVFADGTTRHHGTIYTPTGPRSISFFEVAGQLGRATGNSTSYVPADDDTERQNLLSAGVPGWIADMLVEYGQAYAGGWGDFTTDDFAAIVGRRSRDIADFALEYGNTITAA